MHDKFQNITIGKGIVAILIAGFISIILANTVDMSGYELGALINVFWPPLMMVLAIVIFLLTCWAFKKDVVRFISLTLLCLYLIYVGTALHLEKDWWPLVLW